jgi:tRNA threonylcarbamoyladenosine biosynthesis protein TsaE
MQDAKQEQPLHFASCGLDDLPRLAQTLAPVLRTAQVVAFHGSMGAGKTTLIKALCEVYGVKDAVNSPTFALVNEYRDRDGVPIFQFDYYRINRIEEVYDLGYEEYFYSGNLCLIEWAERIASLLPQDALHVYIEVMADGKRSINVIM